MLLGNWATKLFHLSPAVSDTSLIPSAVTPGTKDVEGYYAEWWDGDTASYDSMASNLSTIKTIIPFWATLHPDGSVSDRGSHNHQQIAQYARSHNLTTLLMVNNSNQSSTSYSIHDVLSDPNLRSKAISNLESMVKALNMSGINIDFETVRADDRDNLTAFMKELSARLKPEGLIVAVDVFRNPMNLTMLLLLMIILRWQNTLTELW